LRARKKLRSAAGFVLAGQTGLFRGVDQVPALRRLAEPGDLGRVGDALGRDELVQGLADSVGEDGVLVLGAPLHPHGHPGGVAGQGLADLAVGLELVDESGGPSSDLGGLALGEDLGGGQAVLECIPTRRVFSF
jgi:hypothetical protein